MNQLPKVCVIGGMNLDLLASPDRPLILRDSNIGHVCLRPGGVGRNIAAMLSRFGCSVSLLTVLGTGEMADFLYSSCRNEKIDLSISIVTDEQPCVYMAVHDSTGDMHVAVNDMAAMSHLTPDVIIEKADFINTCDLCVIDANLSEAVLISVAENVHIPIVADPVSTQKVKRLIPILGKLFLIKPNLLEAQTIIHEAEPSHCAKKLREYGVKNVFISLGKDGVYYDGGSESGMLPVENTVTSPQTGAGDAMLAGLIIAAYQQKNARECAEYGQKAAYTHLTKNV